MNKVTLTVAQLDKLHDLDSSIRYYEADNLLYTNGGNRKKHYEEVKEEYSELCKRLHLGVLEAEKVSTTWWMFRDKLPSEPSNLDEFEISYDIQDEYLYMPEKVNK